jgi:hypothetical protein
VRTNAKRFVSDVHALMKYDQRIVSSGGCTKWSLTAYGNGVDGLVYTSSRLTKRRIRTCLGVTSDLSSR